MNGPKTRAIVVLGGKIRRDPRDPSGLAESAARRRARAAAAEALREPEALVVTSGGRAWDDVVEADALRDALVGLGVDRARIVRERCSLSTKDNAKFVAALLARRGMRAVTIVTCAWHVPRAEGLFRAEGLDVRAVAAAESSARGVRTRLSRAIWERAARVVDGVQ